MIVRSLPGRPVRAVRDALLAHGWEDGSSRDAAAALEGWTCHVQGLPAAAVEALLRVAPKHGLDLLTGDGWVILSGTRSRLSALTRSWTLPPDLVELSVRLGESLPADAPPYWRVRSGPLALEPGPVLVARGEMPAPEGVTWVGESEYLVLPGTGQPEEVLERARSGGPGVLLVADDVRGARAQFTELLDRAALLGVEPQQIALDPAWVPGTDGPDLGAFRAFGLPLAVTTDDPVVAALARLRGADLFRTREPAPILAAVLTADRAGA